MKKTKRQTDQQKNSITEVQEMLQILTPEAQLNTNKILSTINFLVLGENVAGLYSNKDKEIMICTRVQNPEFIILHELGHYIHDTYFNFKKFNFNRDQHRTPYSYTNFKESFAEMFEKYIIAKSIDQKITGSLLQMENIIKSI